MRIRERTRSVKDRGNESLESAILLKGFALSENSFRRAFYSFYSILLSRFYIQIFGTSILSVRFEFDVEISRVVNWLAKSLLRDVPKEFSARRKTLRRHFNSATVYKKEERRDPWRLTFVIYTS